MKRAALLTLLLAFPALSAAQSDERIVKPEIRVGDSWTYRGTNMIAPGTHEYESRVSFANDKAILMVSANKSDGKEADSSQTPELNFLAAHSGIMFRPHSGLFRFPLRVGDKYEVKYEQLRPRVNTVESATTGSVAIVGWETVEVPAGKFRAVKLELDSMVKPLDGSRAFPRQLSVWYAPEVRRWVKLQGETPRNKFSEELLDYKLNED